MNIAKLWYLEFLALVLCILGILSLVLVLRRPTLLMRKYRSIKQALFNFGIAGFGLVLIATGVRLLSGDWAGVGFVGGFLLMTGIQIFCWVIGLRLEILGNVTDEAPRTLSDSETSQVTSPIPEH